MEIEHPAKIDADDVRRYADESLSPQAEQRQVPFILPRKHRKVIVGFGNYLRYLAEIAACLLDRPDVGHFRQTDHRLGLQIAGSARRDVVEDNRKVSNFSYSSKVPVQSFMRRLIVRSEEHTS